MDGELPSADDEIAIDRMYADNNKLKVGDSLTVGGKKLKITGLVALSDYSALYSNPSDMMFDALKFGVAIVTDTLLTIMVRLIFITATHGNMIKPRQTTRKLRIWLRRS